MNQDPEYTPQQQARFLQRIRELEQELGWRVDVVNGVFFVYTEDGVLMYCDPDPLEIYGELLIKKHVRDNPMVLESRGNDAEELLAMAIQVDKDKEALYKANKRRGEREDQP